MLSGTLRRRLRACLLGILVSLPVRPSLPIVAVAAVASSAALPGGAEARARSRGGYSRSGGSSARTPSFGGGRDAVLTPSHSGGYSRSGGSSARTPSFGGGRAAVRTPSTSGGYSRPYGTSPSYTSRLPSTADPSAGDRALSRQQSADALGRYRDQQAAARQAQ